MQYWDWDIDNLKITNLDTGQVMDYDKETSLRGDNDYQRQTKKQTL